MRYAFHALLALLVLAASRIPAVAQDRLKNVPGYERYEELTGMEQIAAVYDDGM